jgi:hypothetical protein
MHYACLKKVVEKVDTLEKSGVCIPYKINGSAHKINQILSSLLTTIKVHFVKQARHS